MSRIRFQLTALAAGLALAAVAAAVPAAAATRTKRILPLQFREWDPGQDSTRSPMSLGNPGAGSVAFHAPLGLPVGARITRVVLWSQGTGDWRSLNINRYGPGRTVTAVATGSDTSNVALPVGKDLALSGTAGVTTIQSGFRYDLMASLNTNAQIWAVDVTYVTP